MYICIQTSKNNNISKVERAMPYPKRNFYEILNVSSSASFEELKSNYKQLILQCHPDKLQQQLEIETTNNLQMNDDPNNLEFIAINEAWNCLKDPIKRKQYDAEQLLRKFHTHNNIYAHIKLNEMKRQPNTEEYFRDQEEEEAAIDDARDSKEKSCNNKNGVSKYIYTYDCRCGGQYIVDDESAEQQYCRSTNNSRHITTQSRNGDDNNGVQDDADNKTNNGSSAQNDQNSPSNNVKKTKNAGGEHSSSSGHSNSTGAGSSKGITTLDSGDDDIGAAAIDDEEGGEGDELIVECSECSLVIILNG